MPKEWRRFHDLEAANPVFTLIYFENRLHDIVHVAFGINTARDRKAQQFVARRIAEHQSANLDCPNTGMPVEFDRQSVTRKLLSGNVRQHARGIDIDGMPAGRLYDGHTAIGDMPSKIARACDAVFEIVRVENLFEADRNGIEVPPRQSAIGGKSFGED